ncbi:MAG TPA: hypothetical protein VGY77_00355 [Gemmataceae bacterium]|jgi:hypothetical protein|nr:hypothetical protein [Gemmataceae bacterium]
MVEKSTSMILEALGRAISDPLGLPLFTSKTDSGFFNCSTSGKQAAQKCLENGYLKVVRSETKGKTPQEICTLTEKGLAFLLSHVSPKQVIEDLVRALEMRNAQVAEWITAAKKSQIILEELKSLAGRFLDHWEKTAPAPNPWRTSGNGSESWPMETLSFLNFWQVSRATEDCPLPELYRHAVQFAPTLSIGHFHDTLRLFHTQEQIYLHPWTGPLYDLPEPSFALLVGHEIAYYASLRKSEDRYASNS